MKTKIENEEKRYAVVNTLGVIEKVTDAKINLPGHFCERITPQEEEKLYELWNLLMDVDVYFDEFSQNERIKLY